MSGPRVLVAGLRASGSGYPNAEQTMRILSEKHIATVIDMGQPLPEALHLWTLRDAGARRLALALARLMAGSVRSLFRVLHGRRNKDELVYVPHPALPFLLAARWLPAKFRPRCVVDAYISLWDSMFNDRARSETRLLGKVIKSIEGWALRGAACILVDTEANRDFFLANFGLSAGKVRSLPLAVDEAAFREMPARSTEANCIYVLFVGTLIPLHGVELILEAARQLAHRSDIRFVIAGDGQQRDLVLAACASGELPNLEWKAGWHPLERISEYVAAADICLGVFGGAAKAARVLPFKLYMYFAAGRPVVSQAALSVPDGAPPPPLEGVAPVSADGLAAAICRLADDGAYRERLALQSRAYYERWLANDRVALAWQDMLLQMGE